MFMTNFKVILVVVGTVTLYTAVASWIPQVASEVPEELSFTGDVTAEQLVEAGEELYAGAGGCVACHGLGTRAPNLVTSHEGQGTIGERCGGRVQGQDCETYLHASLVEPNAYLVEGFEPIMPDMSRTLSDAQIWSLVAYLQNLGGQVTVDPSRVSGDAGSGTTPAQPAAPVAAATATLEPLEIYRQYTCVVCHQLGGEGGPIGPALDAIGAVRDADYIRRSILDPAADTAPGFEALAGTMPPTLGQQMTAAQLEALVSFLVDQKGGG